MPLTAVLSYMYHGETKTPLILKQVS